MEDVNLGGIWVRVHGNFILSLQLFYKVILK